MVVQGPHNSKSRTPLDEKKRKRRSKKADNFDYFVLGINLFDAWVGKL